MGNSFKGKVAVITGSSRGIGKAIAIDFAKKGAKIVLNGRNQERLNEAKETLLEFTSEVYDVCCDVSSIEGGQMLIDKTIECYGQLDILVNNAGVSMRGKVADLNPEVFEEVFKSNVYGTVNTTIPAIPELRKTKGSLVFISSLAGIRGLPGLSAYCSSKMALRALAESIRIEEHQYGIHVGLVYVAMTEIEHNKETIAADGSMITIRDRKKGKVQSMDQVAKAVTKNIQKKRFLSTLSGLGKINRFLQSRSPLLVEKIILKNLHKFEEGSK